MTHCRSLHARRAALYLTAIAFVTAACTERPQADPVNAAQVALGKQVYEAQCAACHGTKLEGQPNWRERLASGKLPAPPHDASGHTWHHRDELLFTITKHGAERDAPPGYQSDMTAFGNQLSDEQIWAVLSYIKSTWSEDIRALQDEATRNATR